MWNEWSDRVLKPDPSASPKKGHTVLWILSGLAPLIVFAFNLW